MSSLYELTNDWEYVLSRMDDNDVDEQVIMDTLEAIEGEIEAKMQNCVFVRRILENRIESRKREIDRMSKGNKVDENHKKSLDKYMMNTMDVLGKNKIETELFTIRQQNNPASVVIDVNDIDDIPIEYLVTQKPTINKKKISEDIKAGVDLHFAHLEQSKGLRIK